MVTSITIGTGTGPDISRARARQLARRELARPEYKPSLLSRLGHDLEHWLSSLASHSAGGSPSWIGVVLLVIAIAAVLAIVFYLGRSARNSRRPADLAVLNDRQRTAAEHRQAADALAAGGRYGDAIVERVRAIAVELETRQILAPRPGRTAAELSAEAGRLIPAEATALRSAAQLFDDVRYGGRNGNEPGYRLVRDLDERVRTAPVPAGANPTGASQADVPAGRPR